MSQLSGSVALLFHVKVQRIKSRNEVYEVIKVPRMNFRKEMKAMSLKY